MLRTWLHLATRNATRIVVPGLLASLLCTCAVVPAPVAAVRQVSALAEPPPALHFEPLMDTEALAPKTEERAPLVLTAFNRPGDRIEVQPYDEQGKLDPMAHEMISRFLRCQRTGRWKLVNPGVVAFLYQISRDYPGKEIDVISGIRWRSKTDGARSPHWRAVAVDLRVKGVSLSKLRWHMWKTYDGIAVGFYPHSGFVHVDVRDQRGNPPVRWVEGKSGNATYALHTAEELENIKPLPREFPATDASAVAGAAAPASKAVAAAQ
jgi:uncharacterized protein YcbK (DUF882 family)